MKQRLNKFMVKVKTASLEKNVFSSLTVILLLSAVIALLARWVLVSSLTSELIARGLGISLSIAEGSRGYILTENLPELTNLLFDARMGHRKPLVAINETIQTVLQIFGKQPELQGITIAQNLGDRLSPVLAQRNH